MDTMRAEIATRIHRACEKLDAGPELLSICGSYGDTLDDSGVLKACNAGKRRTNIC
jgi:hypothetical protein